MILYKRVVTDPSHKVRRAWERALYKIVATDPSHEIRHAWERTL